jgi:recombination protein RecT
VSNARDGTCHTTNPIHLRIKNNTMSTSIALTEKSMLEILKPKMADLIRMIGEDRLTREASFAIQAVNANKYLQLASPGSIAKAVFNMALTRLSLNPISKLAYLTPRKVGGEWEAVLMPSYQGIVKLVKDTESVTNVYAYPVYEGDFYEVTLGTAVDVIHRPTRKSKKILGVYAVAVLPNGDKLVEDMSLADVHEIRARSDSYRAYKDGKIDTCIWVTDEGEMFRKTAIKRVCKYIPKTDKWGYVNEAIALDNSDYPASWGQVDYLLTLIDQSVYDDDTRSILRTKATSDLMSAEAKSMIDELLNNQLEPGKQRDNVSATEAKQLLNKATK